MTLHFSMDLEFEKVGGNIYINFSLAGTMILISGLTVFYVKDLIENYHRVNSIMLFINSLLISIFFFAPLDLVTCSLNQ